jgi:hypothetical protein
MFSYVSGKTTRKAIAIGNILLPTTSNKIKISAIVGIILNRVTIGLKKCLRLSKRTESIANMQAPAKAIKKLNILLPSVAFIAFEKTGFAISENMILNV